MRRREFITLLGIAAAAWPLTTSAQQAGGMRRIGVLMSLAADDPQAQARLAAFVQSLQELGWTDGRNVSIDTRWSAGNAADTRKFAAELVSLAPDLILASGGTVVGTLLQVTSTVPIVFTQTADPVGGGLVASLAQAPLGFSSACVTAEGSRLLTASAPFSSRSQMRRTTMSVTTPTIGGTISVTKSWPMAAAF